jgi:VCBS repeat-containing protein
VTVADAGKVDFESSGGSYSIRIKASDPSGAFTEQSFVIAVTDVAPVATGEVLVTDEDTPIVASAANGLLANDSDVNGGALTAVLDAGPAHGTLQLNADGSYRYLSSQDYNGTDSFTYHVSDGTLSSATVTVALTINPVNDAPVVDAGNTLVFNANTGQPVVIDAGIALHDVDNTTLASAKVAITGGFERDNDSLGFVNGNGITGSYNSATGVLTLTGVASVADYQAALASVTFMSITQSNGTRNIQWTADDGSALFSQSLPANSTIAVSGIIVPPHVFTDNRGTPTTPNVTQASLVFDTTSSGPLVPPSSADGFATSGGGFGYHVVHTDAVLTTAADATVQINLALAALEAPLGGDIAYVVARQANGDPLPDWLKFDPATGTFAGLPPDNAVASIEPDQSADNNIVTGALPPNPDLGIGPGSNAPAKAQTITIEVLARDSKGNIAVTTFTIDLRAHPAGKQGWNVQPLGPARHASLATLSPELAAIEAAVRDVTQSVEPFAARGIPVRHGDAIAVSSAEAAPAGRAGLTEQLASIGWRSMAAQRNALLASLQQGR